MNNPVTYIVISVVCGLLGYGFGVGLSESTKLVTQISCFIGMFYMLACAAVFLVLFLLDLLDG